MRTLLFISLVLTWWVHPLVAVVAVGYLLWFSWAIEIVVLAAAIDIWVGVPAGQWVPWCTLAAVGMMFLKELIVPQLVRRGVIDV